MVPTRRLAVVAFGAAVVSIVAGCVPSLAAAMVAVDCVVALGVLADVLLGLDRRVAADRQSAAIFSVGRPNLVTLHLRNLTGRALRGIVADDPLESCEASGIPAPFELAPHATAMVRYHIFPLRRGKRDFGAITVRYASPLGLVDRQERTPIAAIAAIARTIHVYPDVHAARALDLLRRQGRQDARLGSLVVRGGDTELERLRPYHPGDDVRHVDWRASARRDEIVVRQLQAESNQNVVFALDVGRGMRGESAGLTAVDHAINAALLTAEVALRAGDKAGLLAFDQAPRGFVLPAAGASTARKLTRAAHALEASLAATDYRAAMAFLRAQVRARSLFIVFTNLLDPRSAEELAASMRGLMPRHVPLCVLLRDTDVEALATGPASQRGDLYVRAAAAEVLAWRDSLIRALTRAGVLVLDVRPHDLTPQLVKGYLAVKARKIL
jgi:uncharacterized protein (DUF58 family)